MQLFFAMKNDNHAIPGDNASLSYWIATSNVPVFTTLEEDSEAEVCIVGAGISGLTAAYLLARSGKRVIVVEDGRIAGGETGRTTAHITNVIDDRYFEMIRLHGIANARIAADSHTAAISQIEAIVKRENINCDFIRVPGYLFFKSSEKVQARLEYEACKKVGVKTEIEHVSGPGALADGYCLKFPDQAQFHALKYISGLARAVSKLGVKIYTHTHISRLENKNGNVTLFTSHGYKVFCKDAIMATNSPISDYAKIHIKQGAYRTYVIAANIPKGSLPAGLYWDNEEPYHYVRIQPENENDVIIIGGEDHKTGQADDHQDRYRSLESWARKRFPYMGEIQYEWSGQVLEPTDGLGFVGLDPEYKDHIYIVTGDSGMGMTHGTFGAMILRDLITGKPNPWADLYSPKRIKGIGEMIKENVNAVSYYSELFTGGEVKNVNEIPAGEGAIIRKGIHKYAVFRDEQGTLHFFNALCTHLKGVVHWNHGEKTWDCPVHGSRFDCQGKVLNGPARNGLEEKFGLPEGGTD